MRPERLLAIKAANGSMEPMAAIDVPSGSGSCRSMSTQQRVCPIVVRIHNGQMEVLAFTHPSAGNQFVKGTIEAGEEPRQAAMRELREESGVLPRSTMMSIGVHQIGPDRQTWHFFSHVSSGLPDTWQHATEDDHGHTFDFFWHPIGQSLDENWHPIFHEAYAFFSKRLAQQ